MFSAIWASASFGHWKRGRNSTGRLLSFLRMNVWERSVSPDGDPAGSPSAAQATHLWQVVATGCTSAGGSVWVQDPFLPTHRKRKKKISQNQIHWIQNNSLSSVKKKGLKENILNEKRKPKLWQQSGVMMPQHLNEAQQGSPSISDAPLPVFAAGPSSQAFKLGGSEPLLAVSDAAPFAPWTQRNTTLS